MNEKTTGHENTRSGHYLTPRVDIIETEEELTLLADLPGVRSDDVNLRYDQGELVLHARARPRQTGKRFLLHEYGEAEFYRAFSVHETVDGNRITAECKNGVLTVHLPKAAPAKPRQVKVQTVS